MNANFVMHLQTILDSSVENDSDHMIAAYILKHMFELKNVSIQDMARDCFTSTSTISRFVKEIGFQSLSELKSICAHMESYVFELTNDSLKHLNFDKTHDHEIVNQYTDMLCSSLQNFSHTIDFAQIDALNQMIYDNEHIAIFGIHLPGSFAKYYQYMMMSIGKFMESYDLQAEHLKKSQVIQEGALVVIFSMEGNYLNTNKQVLLNLKKRKAKLILITQNPINKYIDMFDHVLYLGDMTFAKAGRYKLQLFIEILYNRYVQEYYHFDQSES